MSYVKNVLLQHRANRMPALQSPADPIHRLFDGQQQFYIISGLGTVYAQHTFDAERIARSLLSAF